MWRTLGHMCNFQRPTTLPEAREIYQDFSNMSNAPDEHRIGGNNKVISP